MTNLFVPPSPVEIDGRFFEDYLIHRTARGEMVRSKSEVIIADHLANNGIEYGYEQPLTIEGITKYPDFTIEDMESGLMFYWEHCGMLHVPSYRRRWEEKLGWYRTHGILPLEEENGENGTLIITRDEANGSIDSAKITTLITDVLNRSPVLDQSEIVDLLLKGHMVSIIIICPGLDSSSPVKKSRFCSRRKFGGQVQGRCDSAERPS